jgi:uncharacterized membrane protein
MRLNKNIYIIAGFIAVVLIVALFLTNSVDVTVKNDGTSFSADKNTPKDNVDVEDIKGKSRVTAENRPNQDISIKKVDGGSDVKVK